MSLEIVWVELNDSFKQFYSFLVVFSTCACFYLSQNSESLKAVFEFWIGKNFLEVLLRSLEVSQMVLDFSHTKMAFVVFRVVLQAQLIVLRCLLKVSFNMLNFSQNEIKIAAKDLNFRPERAQLSTISPTFMLYNLQCSLADLLALCKLTIKTEMVR